MNRASCVRTCDDMCVSSREDACGVMEREVKVTHRKNGEVGMERLLRLSN